MKIFEIERLSSGDYEGDEFSIDDDDEVYTHNGLYHAEELMKRAQPVTGFKNIFWLWHNEIITLLVDNYQYDDRVGPAKVGKLSLYSKPNYKITGNKKQVYQVGTIAVQKGYRGRGLGALMYQLALRNLKILLISGGEQTPAGREAWFNLSQTPGVEVNGLLEISSEELEGRISEPDEIRKFNSIVDALMGAGFYHIGKVITHYTTQELFLYPVGLGKKEMKVAADKALFKLYKGYNRDQSRVDYDMNLIARWAGK